MLPVIRHVVSIRPCSDRRRTSSAPGRHRPRPVLPSVAGLAIAGVLAGCGSGPAPAAAPSGPVEHRLEVVAGDMWYAPEALVTDAGVVEVTLVNEGAAVHDVVIEDVPDVGDVEVVAAAGRATAVGVVELRAGEYVVYCSIPGHRRAGMEVPLTVR